MNLIQEGIESEFSFVKGNCVVLVKAYQKALLVLLETTHLHNE
jgi:hypothetical protein